MRRTHHFLRVYHIRMENIKCFHGKDLTYFLYYILFFVSHVKNSSCHRNEIDTLSNLFASNKNKMPNYMKCETAIETLSDHFQWKQQKKKKTHKNDYNLEDSGKSIVFVFRMRWKFVVDNTNHCEFVFFFVLLMNDSYRQYVWHWLLGNGNRTNVFSMKQWRQKSIVAPIWKEVIVSRNSNYFNSLTQKKMLFLCAFLMVERSTGRNRSEIRTRFLAF